ncbi:MAG: F0F1 ATP synthase subunit A [Deltaproteobacteria bacterium]|nr:F0F1 ATP synthase subunit A [Deltaproteobacteria bacterium]
MKRLLLVLASAAMLTAGGDSALAEGTVQHEAAVEHAQPEEAKGEEHHWSLADYLIPMTAVEFAKSRFGTSVLDHTPVTHVTHVAFALVVAAIVLVLLMLAVARMKADKDGLLPQSRFNPLAVFQLIADSMLGLMEGIMGRELALKFLPLIGSLAVFILFSNLMGLIPGFLPPTDNLNTTFGLGVVVFVLTHYYGIKAHGISYFKHFFGPILKWYALPLMLLMFIIEMISHFARPVSLSVRLLGNIFGDHAVLTAFVMMAIPLVPVPFILLGLLVSVVQTMVFCILSTVYITLAVAEEDH